MPHRRPKRKPKASGRNIAESERHTSRVTLRLPPDALALLDELRGTRQRSAYVTRLVRVAAGIDPEATE